MLRNQPDQMIHNLALFPEENPHPVLRADRNGLLLYANAAAAALLRQWQSTIGARVPDFVIQELALALHDGQSRKLEAGCEERDYSLVLVPIRDRGYVNFYGRDVTHDKQVAAQLVKSQESLKRAQEIAHLGSWELDLIDNHLSWSDEVYRIFGLEPQEFEASYQAFLEAVHPEDRAAVDEAYSSSLRTGRDSYEIEHRIIRRATGEIRHVHEKCEHVRDATGKVVRSLGMVHDVTERTRREQEIEKLNADLKARAGELEDANQELQAFNYTVAHDLRKPLTVIRGYGEVLLDSCEKLDEKSREYLRKIQTGTQQMSRLIDALLEFSRLSHAEVRIDRVDLTRLARLAAAELQASQPERRVSFRIARIMPVCGDEELLQVVMNNLLGNAWKYTNHPDEAVIEVGTTRTGGVTTCFVRDNGIGFNPADTDQLFVPFQRLKKAEGTSGFGIGLATVERIIRRHGGRVWAEGTPGQGARFYFTLPGTPDRTSETADNPETSEASAAPDPGDRLTRAEARFTS